VECTGKEPENQSDAMAELARLARRVLDQIDA